MILGMIIGIRIIFLQITSMFDFHVYYYNYQIYYLLVVSLITVLCHINNPFLLHLELDHLTIHKNSMINLVLVLRGIESHLLHHRLLNTSNYLQFSLKLQNNKLSLSRWFNLQQMIFSRVIHVLLYVVVKMVLEKVIQYKEGIVSKQKDLFNVWSIIWFINLIISIKMIELIC